MPASRRCCSGRPLRRPGTDSRGGDRLAERLALDQLHSDEMRAFRPIHFSHATRIPFGEHHWREALSAFRRFGRSRHPAALNFGDCIAYATAKLAGEPLLFVGDDFTKTDLEPA